MSDSIRPVVSSEYQTALDLWCDVFGVEPEYFRRYYHGDPFYRPGDTLGAWVDGTLAAAVHVVRRPVLWRGRTITMAGIANVATRPEYRSRGLSTALLTALWEKIEGDDFDFGQLGTGIPPFYERLGWESVPMGLFQVNMERAVPHATGVCEEVGASFDLLPLYRRGARPLAIARTPDYMAQWVSCAKRHGPDRGEASQLWRRAGRFGDDERPSRPAVVTDHSVTAKRPRLLRSGAFSVSLPERS